MAASFKQRAIAVVPTGKGCDGAREVQAIRKMGGVVFAQKEATCACRNMLGFVIDTTRVDLVLSPDQFAFALETLVMTEQGEIGA